MALEDLMMLRMQQIKTLGGKLHYLTSKDEHKFTVSYATDLDWQYQIKLCKIGLYCFYMELRRYEAAEGS